MYDRKFVRNLAQQSAQVILLLTMVLGLSLVVYAMIWESWYIGFLSVIIIASTANLSWLLNSLAREIVRLEEKIETLERRIS